MILSCGVSAAERGCRDRAGSSLRSRRRRLPRHPDQLHPERNVGIDVAFWFMEDARYTTELIRKHQAGVPVRVLVDPRANPTYPLNAGGSAELQAAGIPMRKRLDQLHPALEDDAVPRPERRRVQRRQLQRRRLASGTAVPYETTSTRRSTSPSDTAITNSFRKRFDDHWIDTTDWANYANITPPLVAPLRHRTRWTRR